MSNHNNKSASIFDKTFDSFRLSMNSRRQKSNKEQPKNLNFKDFIEKVNHHYQPGEKSQREKKIAAPAQNSNNIYRSMYGLDAKKILLERELKEQESFFLNNSRNFQESQFSKQLNSTESKTGRDLSQILKSQVPLPKFDLDKEVRKKLQEDSFQVSQRLWKKMEKQIVNPESFVFQQQSVNRSFREKPNVLDVVQVVSEQQNRKRLENESHQAYINRLQQMLEYQTELNKTKYRQKPEGENYWTNSDLLSDRKDNKYKRRQKSMMTFYQIRNLQSRNNLKHLLQDKRQSIINLEILGKDAAFSLPRQVHVSQTQRQTKQNLLNQSNRNLITETDMGITQHEQSYKTQLLQPSSAGEQNNQKIIYKGRLQLSINNVKKVQNRNDLQGNLTKIESVSDDIQNTEGVDGMKNLGNTLRLFYQKRASNDPNDEDQYSRNMVASRMQQSYDSRSDDMLEPITQKLQPIIQTHKNDKSPIIQTSLRIDGKDNFERVQSRQANNQSIIEQSGQKSPFERALSSYSKLNPILNNNNDSGYDSISNYFYPEIRVDFQKQISDQTDQDKIFKIQSLLQARNHSSMSNYDQRMQRTAQRFPNLRGLLEKLDYSQIQKKLHEQTGNTSLVSESRNSPSTRKKYDTNTSEYPNESDYSRTKFQKMLIEQRQKKQLQLQRLLRSKNTNQQLTNQQIFHNRQLSFEPHTNSSFNMQFRHSQKRMSDLSKLAFSTQRGTNMFNQNGNSSQISSNGDIKIMGLNQNSSQKLDFNHGLVMYKKGKAGTQTNIKDRSIELDNLRSEELLDIDLNRNISVNIEIRKRKSFDYQPNFTVDENEKGQQYKLAEFTLKPQNTDEL
ncbi:UNKNOWN [Stylonychia lemnae]|uniref:Uncharacterized protein n=1 Tax=Stylonychia lemnae TaxID=5949 RepID=A0A077ZQQ8_STYLE|nr:UNKNOWN [Stylonychia lemnae]|eukprot:CDW71720.1 UNKNOWN [Stylonychia lemnae]